MGHLGSAHRGSPVASDARASFLSFAAWARGSGFPYPARGICVIGLRGVMSSFFADGARGGKSSPLVVFGAGGAGGLEFADFDFDIAPMVYLVDLDSDIVGLDSNVVDLISMLVGLGLIMVGLDPSVMMWNVGSRVD